ncbi:putative superfamily III holin-X [Kineococcus xinjiangensis]|uniref:Putative superfamily III holin-X n=1 Tax=Kineococcus xinjiangensis TaxID=512762 RepID=A0A2S6IT57_9ACTN|nr:phage holin family protein [Kineococcus xinjiangensis]PPK97444.1 putative superfamily III holin-X [Kineococcus xinjiangensis]
MSGSHPVEDPGTTSRANGGERSIGEIVGSITTEFSTLVSKEVQLAKTELREDAKKAGKGAGMFAGAAVAGLLFLMCLSALLVLVLGDLIGYGWATLIVTLIWGIVAAVLAMRGKKEFQKIPPPLEKTTITLKEDVQWAKHPTS